MTSSSPDTTTQHLLERLRENGMVVLQNHTGRAARWVAALGAAVLVTASGAAPSGDRWRMAERSMAEQRIATASATRGLAQEVRAAMAVASFDADDQARQVLLDTAQQWKDPHIFEELLRDALHRGLKEDSQRVLNAWGTSGTPGLLAENALAQDGRGGRAAANDGKVLAQDWKEQAWQRIGSDKTLRYEDWVGPGFVPGNPDVLGSTPEVMDIAYIDELPQPDGWVGEALAKGWTGAEIFAHWQERLTLGDGQHEHWARTPGASDSQEWIRLRQMRESAQKALRQVKTPEDWAAYQQGWARHLKNQGTIKQQAGWPVLNAVAMDPQWSKRSAGQSWEFEGSDDFLAWRALAESRSTWAFLDNPEGAGYPVAKDQATARQWLDEALTEAGLASLRWPVQTPDTPQALSWLAHEVRSINLKLQTLSGWQGPVLGLGGKVHLDIVTSMEDGSDGGMLKIDPPKGESSFALVTVVADSQGLGPVAHEWLHAVEMLAGEYRLMPDGEPGAGGTSYQAQKDHIAQAQQALQTAITQAPFVGQDERLMHAQDFIQRWRTWEKNINSADLLTVAGGILNSSTEQRAAISDWLVQTIDQGVPPPFAGDGLALLAAAETSFPSQVLSRHTQTPIQEAPVSWWVQLSRQEDEGLERPYWASPVEMTARAFEAQWQRDSTNFSQNERSEFDDQAAHYLRRPTQAEAAAHQAAWKDFFGALGPWWSSVHRPPLAARSNLTEHMQARALQRATADGAGHGKTPRNSVAP